MQRGQSADSDLRSRKCGNNNKHINGDVNDSLPWLDKAQTPGKSNIERGVTTDNYTQVTKMSTSHKSTTSHHSSLFKSSAEDLDKGTDSDDNVNETNMWRNELPQADDVPPSPDMELSEEQEVSVPASKKRFFNFIDIALRTVIVLVFFKLETMTAFKREIHAEELWLYRNPPRPDIVKGSVLLFLVITVPLVLTLVVYAFTRNRRDFVAASWAWTLAVCMNGIPTSLLKITVGRPRPDYFYRCFPDGIMVLNETVTALGSSILDFNCTGRPSIINEGRKSFPSGHSSFAFASFGFVAYYIGAKLHAFDARGRGQTWRLVIALTPLFVAALVAVSRTCDYHHHWQDITVGAIIGLITGYYSYRQYYPSIFSEEAGKPYIRWPRRKRSQLDAQEDAGGDVLRRPLLVKQQSKWS